MFVNRVETLLKYYIAARNVTTFDKLISLLVLIVLNQRYLLIVLIVF